MKNIFTPYISIAFFLLGILNGIGQKLELKTTSKDSINLEIFNSLEFNHFHQTENSIHDETDSISFKLQNIGFLNNYIDTIQKQDSIFTAYYYLGENTEVMTINYNPNIINVEIIKTISLEFTNTNFKVSINNVSFVLNEIINQLENDGNSFAKVSLKNISKSKNGLIADLYIDKTIQRKIDRINLIGYSEFPKSYTKYYLNLKEGTIFNTKKLEVASEAISSLSFVSETKPPEILFTNDSTTVYLYLQKNKSNKFDGLIGFSTNQDGKLKFNGYLDLLLNNVLNKGEVFSIKWQSNGKERKVFDLAIETPYTFNAPISPKATFNIYKQDSTFLNVRATVDISLSLNQKNNILAKFQTEKSNDLSNNNNQTNNITEFTNTFYGIAYNYKLPNHYRSSQNKVYFNINLLFGNRRLKTEPKNTKQQKYEFTATYNWSLNQKNTIYFHNSSRILVSDNLFSNELYRIGGANSIRGFNEDSIFSSAYSILNLEYRYHLADRSHIYTISDFAYTQNDLLKEKTQLYGFGFGYVYSTKAGLIDISYALGKKADIPLDFNNSKFHIKLIQFF